LGRTFYLDRNGLLISFPKNEAPRVRERDLGRFGICTNELVLYFLERFVAFFLKTLRGVSMAAWAAAKRAMGTRNGLHDT
jgi:hypothetical protein